MSLQKEKKITVSIQLQLIISASWESSPRLYDLEKNLSANFGGFLLRWMPSLKLTNSLHLKMDGWNTSFLLGWPIFSGYVSFRECKHGYFFILLKIPIEPWTTVDFIRWIFFNCRLVALVTNKPHPIINKMVHFINGCFWFPQKVVGSI